MKQKKSLTLKSHYDGLKRHHWFLMHLIRCLIPQNRIMGVRMRERICIVNLAKPKSKKKLCSLKQILDEKKLMQNSNLLRKKACEAYILKQSMKQIKNIIEKLRSIKIV